MRVEIRHSGGPKCSECKSFDMVKVLDRIDLVKDLTGFLEEEWDKRESEIRKSFDKAYKDRAIGYQKVLSNGAQKAVEREKPRSVRFLKKRWQARLEEEIQAALTDLLSQTRF